MERKGVCDNCEAVFKTRSAFVYHKKYEHCGKYQRQYDCVCGWRGTSFDQAEEHCVAKHNHLVNDGFESLLELMKLTKKRRPLIFRRCLKCGVCFSSASAYSLHMADHSFRAPTVQLTSLPDENDHLEKVEKLESFDKSESFENFKIEPKIEPMSPPRAHLAPIQPLTPQGPL